MPQGLDPQAAIRMGIDIYLEVLDIHPAQVNFTDLGPVPTSHSPRGIPWPEAFSRMRWHVADLPPCKLVHRGMSRALVPNLAEENFRLFGVSDGMEGGAIVPVGLFSDMRHTRDTLGVNLGHLVGPIETRAFSACAAFIEANPPRHFHCLDQLERVKAISAAGEREIPLFPSVYSPDNAYLRKLLCRAEIVLGERRSHPLPTKVLSIGSGAGFECVVAAKDYECQVDAVDIQRIAVANTLASALVYGVDHRVRAWESDGLAGVSDVYDLALFNAPYPAPALGDPNTHNEGGAILRRVLARLPEVLAPGGKLLLMGPPDLGPYLPRDVRSACLECFQDSVGAPSDAPFAIHQVWAG